MGVNLAGELLGHTRQGESPWRIERAVETGPLIARNVVVATGDGELFAIDGMTGESMWTRPAVGRLRGADDDGETTIIALEPLGGQGTVVLAVGRDGRVIRQLDVPERVGPPAVLDGYAFLPWDDHLIVIFDLAAGREAARVVSASPLRRARIIDQQPHFGEGTLLAFDEQVVAARRGGGTTIELPDRPRLIRWPWQAEARHAEHDGLRTAGGAAVYARPQLRGSDTDAPTYQLAHQRYLVTIRSLALGLHATDGSTAWAHVGRAPFLGASAGSTSFLVCDADGLLTWLHPTRGTVRRQRTFDAALSACIVQTGTAPPPPHAGVDRAEDSPPEELADQLTRAVRHDDASLLPVRMELLAELGTLEGAPPTAGLIEVAADEEAAPEIRAEARQLLARRRQGAEAMLSALREGAPGGWWCTGPRLPLAELAQALRAMGEQRAAAPLASYLSCLDPHSDAATAVTRALAELGTAAERWPLSRFALAHFCNTADHRAAEAVFAALQALARLGRPSMARWMAGEECASPELRRRLAHLLDDADP